ncbi:alpha/beta hydrolase [Salinibacterium hongtaonis]|uniref:alpha/beta hydrolase n=1 Tax=Homoserinimonas hongtaonis TaxID=2079791 RepID=UPI001F53F0E8|nr:alpha/beta hydrolase [Salinibacterium hongtaonis]
MSRLRRSAVALVAIIPLLLSGCFLMGGESRTTSTPTGEKVDADLQPFYDQVVEWESCGDDFQCATATAPLDWDDPERESIELALIRLTTRGTPMGSLLVNPGGPGGSGVDFVRESWDYATTAQLRDNYDLVGFDPRGVGASSAVSCYDDPDTYTDYLYDITPGTPGSAEWLDAMDATMAEFGADCFEFTGELLGFVDTVSAARDLDLLRAILGDDKLNYLGSSYGTFLGATYADLYPQNTGRLVLDGAIDPASTDFEVTAMQAQGFESAMRAYLADCLTGADCPFTGTVESGMKEMGAIFARLEASPLRAEDGRLLGSQTMFTAVILPLYSADTWQYLTSLITDVKRGSAEIAFSLADLYNGREPDGTFADNSSEAFTAINCLDYPSTSTRETLPAEAAELAALAPVFGPQMSWGGTSCDAWPFEATRVRGPIAADGSAPILVVGTTNDPATPYAWSVALADQLQNGHLVSYDGEGHTAYNKSNQCIDDTVDAFFIDGTVPATDPLC